MANERYVLVIRGRLFLDIDKIPLKTLKLAREYYNLLTDEEKECAYIYDNVKHEKVK